MHFEKRTNDNVPEHWQTIVSRFLEMVTGVADGWASRNPRSSTTVSVDYDGEIVGDFRVTSTVSGKVSPQSRIDLQCEALETIADKFGVFDPTRVSVWAEWQFPSELEVKGDAS
jgi:hypothetical protein